MLSLTLQYFHTIALLYMKGYSPIKSSVSTVSRSSLFWSRVVAYSNTGEIRHLVVMVVFVVVVVAAAVVAVVVAAAAAGCVIVLLSLLASLKNLEP